MSDIDLTPDGVIHDRGRGPEIRGTRITVFDILDYHTKGRSPQYIADLLRLSTEQVLRAITYIEEHEHELMPEYQEMVARAQRGNPPHIRAILAESHKKLMAMKREIEAKKAAESSSGGAGDARAAG
jgi:uncharacterized protein (DUF433 family)